MLSTKPIYDFYSNEIDIKNVKSFSEQLLKLLILYKAKAKKENYLFQNTKLSCLKINPTDATMCDPETTLNQLIIGGNKFLPEDCVDEKVTAYLNLRNPNYGIKVYINEATRTTHIFYTRTDLYTLEITYSILPIITKLMPWYFKNVPSKYIAKIALDLKDQDFDSLNWELEQALEENGILQDIRFKEIEKIGVKLSSKRITDIQNMIEEKQRSVNIHMDEISNLNCEIKKLFLECQSLQLGIKELENPLMEIVDFVKNTSEDIKIIDVNKGKITFQIRAKLTQYSKEQAETHINNLSSYFYNDGYGYSEEARRKLFELMFFNDEFKIWSGANIILDIKKQNITSSQYTNDDIAQHPHLGAYVHCFGTASGVIMQYLGEYRFTEALSQIIYSVKQFTISDAVVGGSFISSLFNVKAIECPDGIMRSGSEIIKEWKLEGDEEQW